jgi:hypothetical protein
MKATIESTTKIVELETSGGARMQARVWEGVSENGVPFHAFIVRVGASKDADLSQFEADLKEQAAPSVGIQAIPLRLII